MAVRLPFVFAALYVVQVQGDNWHETEVMAKGLQTYSDVEKATEVNGVRWSLLEQRAQACDEACTQRFIHEDPAELMPRSFSGYIAKNETLRSVIERDWETVHKLRTTHAQLALHLRAMLSLADKHEVSYDVSAIEGNTLPQAHGPQPIVVEKMQTNGYQVSMFWNINHTFPSCEAVPFDDQFDCTYSVRNTKTNRALTSIGAQCGFGKMGGQIAWIEQLGFYEGSIEYRLDPVTLYQIITGDRPETHIMV